MGGADWRGAHQHPPIIVLRRNRSPPTRPVKRLVGSPALPEKILVTAPTFRAPAETGLGRSANWLFAGSGKNAHNFRGGRAPPVDRT
jgi:hypothetical protein